MKFFIGLTILSLFILLGLSSYSTDFKGYQESIKAKNEQIKQLNIQLDSVKKELAVCNNGYEFDVYASPSKNYITKGETYEAEIGLAVRKGPQIKTILAGDRELKMERGRAIYKDTPNYVGARKFSAAVVFKNPKTQKMDTLRGEYIYETGVKTAAIQARYPKVLYTRQDNIITIAAGGISSNNVKISATGGGVSVHKLAGNKYSLRVTRPGKLVRVKLTDASNKQVLGTANYYVKNIRDLVLRTKLGDLGMPQRVKVDKMRKQKKLNADFAPEEYQGDCWVYRYVLEYTPKDGKKQYFNSAWEDGWRSHKGEFRGEILKVVQQAQAGDRYKFTNVLADCKDIHHATAYSPNRSAELIFEIE